MYKRIQYALKGTIHVFNIPASIHQFAVMQQLKQHVSKKDLPTLADIYYQLILEGLEMIKKGSTLPPHTAGNLSRRTQFILPPELHNRENTGKIDLLKKNGTNRPNIRTTAVTLMQMAVDKKAAENG